MPGTSLSGPWLSHPLSRFGLAHKAPELVSCAGRGSALELLFKGFVSALTDRQWPKPKRYLERHASARHGRGFCAGVECLV